MREVRSLEFFFFFCQIGIFLLLVVGIGFISKLLGKYSLYFLLALTFTALIFAVLNTNDFSNRPSYMLFYLEQFV